MMVSLHMRRMVMSLINRIEFSNFLDGKRDPSEWRPDYRWVTMNLHCFSTAFKATNGLGKTSITNAIFALLTWKKFYIKQLFYALAPSSEQMTHVRLELIRPFREDDGQNYLIDSLFKVRGEPWVLGMCVNRGEDPQFYHFQGRLEDAPLGWWEGSVMHLHDDKDILGAAAAKGKIVASSKDWKQFVHRNHISRHHLGMLESFHRQGGGDNSADLFPVTEKADERYDSALFYAHIAPQLMVGLHRSGDEEGDEEEYFFEDTLIRSSQRLCETKFTLERNQAELDRVKGTFEGMRSLVTRVDEIDAAKEKYRSELVKVAEIGAIVETIAGSGLPGVPVCQPSSDQQINLLVEHMAVKPGYGPVLRAPGMDALLKKPEGSTVDFLSKYNLPSSKVSQPIENFLLKDPATDKSRRPKSGRFLTMEEALHFINTMSDEALGISGKLAKSERQQMASVVQAAFTHYKSRLDTSPHRRAVVEILTAKEQLYREIVDISDAIKADKIELSETRRLFEELAGPRSQWERLKSCPDFTEKDLEDPEGLRNRLDSDLNSLNEKVESLAGMLGGIQEMGVRLKVFRGKHGVALPSQIKTEIEGEIEKLNGRAVEIDQDTNVLTEVLRELRETQKGKVEENLAISQEFSVLESLSKSATRLADEWGDMDAEQIGKELEVRREALEKKLDEARLRRDTVKSASETLRRLGRRAGELARQVQKNKHHREELAPGISLLDSFEAKHGNTVTPSELLQMCRGRSTRLNAGVAKLNGRVAEWTSAVNNLKNKGVAPGRVATTALTLIPGESVWQPLWQFIESCELPQADRAKALTTLSSLLFSPVLEDKEDAQALAVVFEENGLPVPVFLADGAVRALRSGRLDEIATAVQGNMGEAAELLIHPERKQNRIDRLKRRMEAALKGIAGIEEFLKPLREDAPEMVFLMDVEKARLGEVRKRYEGLLNEAAGLADEERQVLEEVHWVADMLGTPLEAMDVNDSVPGYLERSVGHLNSIARETATEAEKHFASAQAGLKDFDKDYGTGSPFAGDLSQMRQFADRGGTAELARLKHLSNLFNEELTALNTKIEDKERQSSEFNAESVEVTKSMLAENARLVEFDYEALQSFIESGEGRETDILTIKLEEAKATRTQVQNKLGYDFKEAAKYVPAQSEDMKRQDRLRTIEEAVGRRTQERSERSQCAESLQKDIDILTDASREYDGQIVVIQGIVRLFGKLLDDIGEVKQAVQGESAFRVHGLIEEISGVSRENWAILADNAAEIVETLQSFNAQSKVERAKTASYRIADLIERYKADCRNFLREMKANLVPALEREVNDSISNPSRIRITFEDTARIVQEKQEKLAISQREHTAIWDDQVDRLADLAGKAKDSFNILKRVCSRHESGATYFFNAVIASTEEIKLAVESIRDLVADSVDKEEKAVAEGKITREWLNRKRRQNNGELYESIRRILYKTIFKEPSMQVTHPAIAGGKKLPVERKNVSEGQLHALKLLLLVRLAQFSKERDSRRDLPMARHRRKLTGHEHSFIILDGIFSNLSEPFLIDESLKALSACRGAFQLIGLIHNEGYINNYDIFPTFIVAKKYASGKGLSQDYWTDVESSHHGESGVWQSTIVRREEQHAD